MRNFSAELDSLLFDAAEAAMPQLEEPVDVPSAESLAMQLGIPLPELNRRVHAEKLRRSFADFFRESWPVLEPSTPLSWSWHIEVVCGHIQRLIEDHVKKKADPSHVMEYSNSVINVPPGTAKSRMLMVAAPAWAWERWPGLKFFCLSGNPSNVTRDAGFCRDLIQSDWYQNLFKPDWELRDDQNAVTRYTNTKGGERCSKGITAKVTGDRGDIILLDDPNDVKEADSEAIRNGINSDWDSSIYNRVNHYGAAVRIIIQQRVHEEDFSGHVLSKGNWVHLKLPLEYEVKNQCECHSCKSGILGDYDIRTEEGEVLHPERFTTEVIEDLKITLGEEGYAGQCQQNPDPASGGKFKWAYWRFWKPDGGPDIAARPDRCYKGPARVLPEEFNDIIMTTDCAFKGKPKHDRVATFVVARLGADRFIIGRDCDNMDFGETQDSIRALAKAHPRAGAKLVEGKANGPAIVEVLRREITGMIDVDPKGGKEARAAVLKPVVQAGNYYLPDGAPWLDDFCAEFARFPRGKHDDQIDAISQGEVYMQDEPEDDVYVPGTLYTR